MRKFLLCVIVCILGVQPLLAQTKTVTGRVVNDKSEPLAGVTVSIRGTQNGTITDADGVFSLTIPASAKKLYFSSVSFEEREINIPSSLSMSVVLNTKVATIEEVVVTGYTREKKSNYAGSAAKVAAKAINQVPNGSIDQILQGRAPGLYVTAGSGQPGANANVIIRGVGSISGTNIPLYIMDGVPVQGNAFAALSPGDIESVDVLKDATATALYGSRGSNGVIVITTKRGRNTDGRIRFTAKSQFGVSTRTTPKFEMMDVRQRLQFEEEIGSETGQDIGPGWRFSPKNPAYAGLPAATQTRYNAILDSLRNMNVDWLDIFFQRGKTQEHEVSATGGSDKLSFFSSFNYFKQDGIARRSFLERYSLRNNVDFKTKNFTAGLSTTINVANQGFIEGENLTSIVNPFASAYYALPYEQPYVNGVLVHPGIAFSAPYNVYDLREGTAALERNLSTTNKRQEIKAVVGANLRYSFTKDLSFISTLGLDYRDLLAERLVRPDTYTGSQSTGGRGSFGESSGRIVRLFGNAGLNYSRTFAQKHAVDVTALAENTTQTVRNFTYTGFGINPALQGTPQGITPGSATGFIPTLNGARDFQALVSAMGILKYSYDGKYTLNVSYRADGSSQVPEKNRWLDYYSVGASWNIMKEKFMDKAYFFNDLLLKASYGISASPFTGSPAALSNVASPSYGYLTAYQVARYDGQSGVTPNTIGNDEYTWETATISNIGIDFTMWKRRLRGTVEVYRKLTENLFVNQQLSRTSGANALTINAGKLENRGIEFSINADIVSSRDFLVTIGGNISNNKNEILSLGLVNEFVQGTSIIRVGLPLGTHYIPKWGGVDASTGNPLYYTKDGVLTTTYNASTMSVAEFGSWLPKVNGGFNGTVTYKGFSVEAFFSFAGGNKAFNNEDFFNENTSFSGSNQSTLWFQRWRKPGDVTNIQRFGTARRFSSKDIQDRSYIRFRNLNVAYDFPTTLLQKGFMKGIRSIRIIAQAQNLFTWTNWRGFDPEDNNNISTFEYPGQRTYTAGINLGF
jgi:TonB-linked SusC/RagA family outer membrane protein